MSATTGPADSTPQFHMRDRTCEIESNEPVYDARHGLYHIFLQDAPLTQPWPNGSLVQGLQDTLLAISSVGPICQSRCGMMSHSTRLLYTLGARPCSPMVPSQSSTLACATART